MKKVFRKIILVIIIATAQMGVSAQVFSDPGGGAGDNPDEEQVPIDGGVGLLIAAGVAYGAKKARDHRKKNREVAETNE